MGTVKHDLDVLLAAARETDEPDEGAHARVRKTIARRIAAGAAAGIASGAAGTAASAAGVSGVASSVGLGAKVLAALVLAGAAGFSGASVVSARSASTRAQRTAPVRAAARPATPVRAAARPPSWPALRGVEREPASSALPAAAPSGASVRAASVTARASTQASDEAAWPDEVRRFAAARNALPGDPARSLALLDEYAARYPQGQFRDDVDGARAIALCAVRRGDEGRALVRALERSGRGALFLDQARAACGAGEAP